MATPESMSEAALARKRRIAMRRNRQRSSSAASSSSATISSFADNEEEIQTSVKNSKRSLSALQEDDVEEDTPIFVSSSTSICEEVVAEEDDVQQTPPKKQKPHITGIKKQSRYDPGVTLNKEELKVWRKEARRVRNRESAAASRKKNRESIESLQTKVDDMKAKYTAALQYILGLEGEYEPQQQQTTTIPSPSTTLRQDLEEIKKTLSSSSPGIVSVSRPCSPVRGEGMLMSVQTVSPPTSPIPQAQEEEVQQEKIQRRHPSKVQISNNQDKNTPNNHPLSDHDHHYDHHPTSTNSQSQHIIDTMISRPIACV
jgi:hypothetical protein